LKAWPILAVCIVQGILFLAHVFVLHTWVAFWPPLGAYLPVLRPAFYVLALSFAPATLLAFKFSNSLAQFCYSAASIWLGFFNFIFFAACLSWLGWYAIRLAVPSSTAIRPFLCAVFTAAALLAGFYGILNARVIRVRKIAVRLPHLPDSWRGRTAVMLSDLHLGPINGAKFCARIAGMCAELQPDIVFLPGDLFDGTHAHLERLLTPFQQLHPRFGIFFSTGNHEEFSDPAPYLEAITEVGIRVLVNERVIVDGLSVAGISYSLTHSPIELRTVLESIRIQSGETGILLNHVPTRLPLVEGAGFTLQLSGHTHRGQIVPFTWITKRVFGPFTYGLNNFGALQVYTSSGAGTWGPPMRIGSAPEIVQITFE
jgi:predicted MPP superfamily phosphohydrolase